MDLNAWSSGGDIENVKPTHETATNGTKSPPIRGFPPRRQLSHSRGSGFHRGNCTDSHGQSVIGNHIQSQWTGRACWKPTTVLTALTGTHEGPSVPEVGQLYTRVGVANLAIAGFLRDVTLP